MKVYKYKINDCDYTVRIDSIEDNVAEVTVNDVLYSVQMDTPTPARMPKPTPAATVIQPADAIPAVARTASPGPAATTGVRCPLPGVVMNILVDVGQQVKVGQRLMVLEAMKMENNIDSDRDGIVKSISVNKGDSVLEGDVMMVIE